MTDFVIKKIIEEKLILIVRGYCGETLINILEAAYRGGIRLAEITYNACGEPSDDFTAGEIAACVKHFEGRMLIGAGTVLKSEQVVLTQKAGGRFIISPDTDPGVIAVTKELGLVSIPGAFTPTEAAAASKAGADFVKLFPAGRMGPGYLKDLCAPLSHVRFLAVGGIGTDNVREYAAAGTMGFGVGGSILDKKLIASGDFAALESNFARLTAAVRSAYSSETI